MKRVGLVGGIGPESTIEYYRLLIAAWRARITDGSYPPLLVNSIDLTRMIGLVGAGRREELIEYLLGEVVRLARAGADFVVLASNTPHLVFAELRERAPVPMISIVEATRDAARTLGLTRVGLFGTRFTMEADFYPKTLGAGGISVAVPDAEDRAYIHEKYMGELVAGIVRPETRERLLAIAARLREKDRIEAVVLGGTELPLILRDAPGAGVPFLDTTAIHVKAIVDEMVA